MQQLLLSNTIQFELAICIPHHNLRLVMLHTLGLRQNRRSRRSLRDLDNAMSSLTVRPRWVMEALRLGFSLYCGYRRMACPWKPQPLVADSTQVDLPRRVVHLLQRHGVHWMTERHRFSIKAQGLSAWKDLWARMAGTTTVMWMDIYHCRRYTNNPARSDASLNCTVVAVLLLPSIRLPGN